MKSLKILFGKTMSEDFELYEFLQYFWVRILKWLTKNHIAGVGTYYKLKQQQIFWGFGTY